MMSSDPKPDRHPGGSADVRMAPWLRVVSSLPLSVLYALTGAAMFLILRVLRLRLDVVRGNIRGCFPQLDSGEVNRIAAAYYRQVGQMVAEAFKAAALPATTLTRRVTVKNLQLAQDLLAQGRPVLLIAAHQANWEWALHTMSLQLGYPLDVGYKPIRSAWAERAMYAIRSRFGAHMVPAKELLPDLLQRRHIVRGIAMLADQEPTSSDHKHWLKFLGRDTAFYMGAEQMARATRYASLFVALRRVRRGHYELEFMPLGAAGEKLEPGELTTRYARLVEAQILAAPADWTWSHRRWKLKKGVYGAG
ncbi:MAG: lysophospholipid acyltransferase family protein [Casimicrobiaceae bacterium]